MTIKRAAILIGTLTFEMIAASSTPSVSMAPTSAVAMNHGRCKNCLLTIF